MGASKPPFLKWAARKYQAMVINDIYHEVFVFAGIATMAVCISKFTSHDVAISNALLSVLGTVLSLVVSFRTSSAYERYSEGRKLWATIQLASRTLAQQIWIHVSNDREDKNANLKPRPGQSDWSKGVDSHLAGVMEKKSFINLVQAFSVSVKHMLRGEPGIYYEDLWPLVCFLPRYAALPPQIAIPTEVLPLWKASDFYRTAAGIVPPTPHPNKSSTPSLSHDDSMTSDSLPTLSKNSRPKARRQHTFDPEKALPIIEADRPLDPARMPPPTTVYDLIPLLNIFKPIAGFFNRKLSSTQTADGRDLYPAVADSNVPTEIILYLSSYHAWLIKKGLVSPALATGMLNQIGSLQEQLLNLQRIRNTPLPFAYQAHLRMSMWMYLAFLPFQILEALGWLTIPATAFASFLFLGFLEIGQEIENPFGYDLNDLDLDMFCLNIQRELSEVVAHTSPDPDTYVFTNWNQPFAPADKRSAAQIIQEVGHEYHGLDTGMSSVRRAMLQNWSAIDAATHQYLFNNDSALA